MVAPNICRLITFVKRYIYGLRTYDGMLHMRLRCICGGHIEHVNIYKSVTYVGYVNMFLAVRIWQFYKIV